MNRLKQINLRLSSDALRGVFGVIGRRRFFNQANLLLFLLIAMIGVVLDGCGVRQLSTKKRAMRSYDRAPTRHIDYQRVPDALPKQLKFHPYGTLDYTVRKRRYHVRKTTKGYVRRGYASWYGTSFHGRLTATQDIYDLYGMTAASLDLPLPCYAEVTNLANGRRVIVKVNDRGPFYGNRILDLSYAAAQRLGFARQGVAYVQVVALGDHNWDYARNAPKRRAAFLQKTPYFFERGAKKAAERSNKTSKSAANTNVAAVTAGAIFSAAPNAASSGMRSAAASSASSHVPTLAPNATPKQVAGHLLMPPIEERVSGAGRPAIHSAQAKKETADNLASAKISKQATKETADNLASVKISNKTPGKIPSKLAPGAKWLQVASFGGPTKARACQERLQRLLPEQHIFIVERPERGLYSVQMGPIELNKLALITKKIQQALKVEPLVIIKR